MSRIIEDEELRALRAMADGSAPFQESPVWEEIAALEWCELKMLDARTRLALGYYATAKSRDLQPEEAAASGRAAR
jgi:hypothetical protein